MIAKVKAKASHFDLSLDPAGLGRVDVKVKIGADGALSAALSFDNPASAEALKGRAGELRTALEQAGFDVAGGALSFTAEGSSDGGAASREWARTAFAAATGAADGLELADTSVLPAQASAWSGQGGLDIRI